MGFKVLLASIGASIITVFAILRSLVFSKIRLRKQHGEYLFELIKSKGKRFILYEEWYRDEMPKEFKALVFLDKIPMIFNVSERMLRAGWQGTDELVNIFILRFHRSKIIKILRGAERSLDNKIPVFVLGTWSSSRIGYIPMENPFNPYLEKHVWSEIDNEVSELKQGRITKTSAILYGKHGNGKTVLVRHLAIKYRLPVYIVTFDKEQSNIDILRMFSQSEGPCIVLFEDFDKYFDGRRCLIKQSRFSFDSLLCVLDGIYTPSGGVAYFMTANEIEKVDPTLRCRPSRFKFIRKIDNPSELIRSQILSGHDNLPYLLKVTQGLNLDSVLFFREYLSQGKKPDEILRMINDYEYEREQIESEEQNEENDEDEKKRLEGLEKEKEKEN